MLPFLSLAAMVASALCAPQSNFIFKDNITPEEAQGYLNSLPFKEPALAGRTAVLPLVRYDDPRFRSVDAGPTNGHYWKNGKEIENTDDFVEEVYNAAQYHGQDGLGQYAYGYETPESAKVEDRKGSGLTSGSYIYRAPNNDIVKVKYWADSQGFHQEDNLPKVELKPAEETPALREARLAFEKAWKIAAEANSRPPVDPYYYQGQASQGAPQQYNQYNDYQGQASELQKVSVASPNDPGRLGKAYGQDSSSQQYQQQYNPQQQYNQQQQYTQQQQQYTQQQQQQQQQQQYTQQQQHNQYNQQQQYGKPKYGQQEDVKFEDPEPTGPPHGFFYSFNYPVSIIVPKSEHNPNALPTQ